MRTIIAGSRDIVNFNLLKEAITKCDWVPTVVISGTARGADQLGEDWAEENNIPVERFPANWELYGKRAGYIRNEQMADNAEALIALWDGASRGTWHMINIAKAKGLKVYVHIVE